MSVYNNMAFGLKNRKVPKDEIDKKVRAAAKMLDIEDYLNRKPRALSGGQRQRVALGRAMVREPAVFLLDEPLSNLDAKLRTEMRSRISMLHKQLKTTFVYVTHDQTEAMTMADRIVVMKDGVVQQFDTPQTLYNHPNNVFVAGFIGSPQMNFIDSTIKSKNDSYYAEFSGYSIKLPKRMNKRLNEYVDKQVIFGIRPENMCISKVNDENTIKLHIDIAEMTGADYFLYGKLDEKKIIANVASNQNIESEKDYLIKLDVDRIHIFDKINEKLICD
jgi:multiple sugar transport system ATP-binding protein